MPTQQNHNTLTIHNSDFDQQAARVRFAGRVELTTQEIAAFLRWLRVGPVSDHVIIDFGNEKTRSYVTTGDRVAFGDVDNYVAHEDALTFVNQAMVLSPDRELSGRMPANRKGGSYVGQD